MKKHFQILKPSPLKDGDSTFCRTNYLIAAFSFFIFNSALTCSAQFTTLWTQTSNSYRAQAITANASGIYVAGYSNSTDIRIEKRDLTTGALIAAFGTAGVVTSNPSVDDRAYAITADASGIYVAGLDWSGFVSKWRIEKRDLTTGALIAAFDGDGVVTANVTGGGIDNVITAITADASGIYVAGHYWNLGGADFQWRIEKRNLTTGALIWSQTNDPSIDNDYIQAITADASGIYVAGYDNIPGNYQWRIEKRDKTNGALIAAFGTAGTVTVNPSVGSDVAYAITSDASGIYVAGYDNSPGNDQWRIEKRDLTNGTLIAAFDGDGVVTSDPSVGSDHANAITSDASGIYVAGYDNSPGNNQWRIEKRDLITGALICTHTVNPSTGVDMANAITSDASGIYVAGYDAPFFSSWRIEKYDGVCVPLSVELLSFNAFAENNTRIRCEWSTASELNNDYFAIEHSKDGITFAQITQAPSAAPGGNSSVQLNYEYYDNEPYTGISYYRLKQVDFNGAYEYSPVRAVYIGAISIISIYPNPSSEYIHYTVGSESGGTVTVRLYDALGREVLYKEATIEAGVTEKKVETQGFASGNYLLRITNGNMEKTQKQFVIK